MEKPSQLTDRASHSGEAPKITSESSLQSSSGGRETPSSAATAWAFVKWSRYRLVTAVLECPSSLEMTVTGVPALRGASPCYGANAPPVASKQFLV
jgi:hypothetical protein